MSADKLCWRSAMARNIGSENAPSAVAGVTRAN